MATATLTNYRQSPRKVRLLADLIRGKSVSRAILELEHAGKRGGTPLTKLILSAVANAKQEGKKAEHLVVSDIRVDKGIVMKRMMPRARGSAFQILKRSSHIVVTLSEKPRRLQRELRQKSPMRKCRSRRRSQRRSPLRNNLCHT